MISILIPVYNTEPLFLKQSLDSCLSQDIKEYEVVVVDNGSTNHSTIRILNQYSENNKINLYNCPQEFGKNNISLALNLGLKKAKYDLVARMDSDDIMTDNRLKLQLEFMNNNPEIDILGAQMNIFPNGHTTNHPKFITKDIALKSDWFINHPTVVYKKEKIIKLGGYSDTPEYGAEDYSLWMSAIRTGLKIANMSEVVLFYRTHNTNLTKKRQKHQSYYESIALEKHKLKILIENEVITNR